MQPEEGRAIFAKRKLIDRIGVQYKDHGVRRFDRARNDQHPEVTPCHPVMPSRASMIEDVRDSDANTQAGPKIFRSPTALKIRWRTHVVPSDKEPVGVIPYAKKCAIL